MQEQNNDWQPPPPPESGREIFDENAPRMSEIQTVTNIFFEPGRTFEALRVVPRFILAGLILVLTVTAFNTVFIQKIGFERIVREQINKNPNATPEQVAVAVKMYENPAMQAVGYLSPLIGLTIAIFIGGLFYWGGGLAFGGTLSYWQAISIWVYASMPPTVLMMLGNILVLFLKSPDDIDVTQAQRGLLNANLSFLLDGKTQPLLTTIVSAFDIFAIFGVILAVIGFKKIAKLSTASAWSVVIVFWLITFTIRVVMSIVTGNPS